MDEREVRERMEWAAAPEDVPDTPQGDPGRTQALQQCCAAGGIEEHGLAAGHVDHQTGLGTFIVERIAGVEQGHPRAGADSSTVSPYQRTL